MPENPPEYSDDSNGESTVLSFIVHVWKEGSDSEEQQSNWRGHLTLVPYGERHYFTNIEDIPEMIVNHLKSLQ